MREINEIIVHCSATQPNWAHDKSADWKVQEFRRWHLARGWSDIGYHWAVDRDGEIAAGRPMSRVGAHVKGRNTGTIGICLVGGHGSDATDRASDHFTIVQLKALRALIEKLRRDYPHIKYVTGHNQYAAKACPGFHVPTWYGSAPTTAQEVNDDYPRADYAPDPQAPSGGFWAALVAAVMEFFRR